MTESFKFFSISCLQTASECPYQERVFSVIRKPDLSRSKERPNHSTRRSGGDEFVGTESKAVAALPDR